MQFHQSKMWWNQICGPFRSLECTNDCQCPERTRIVVWRIPEINYSRITQNGGTFFSAAHFVMPPKVPTRIDYLSIGLSSLARSAILHATVINMEMAFEKYERKSRADDFFSISTVSHIALIFCFRRWNAFQPRQSRCTQYRNKKWLIESKFQDLVFLWKPEKSFQVDVITHVYRLNKPRETNNQPQGKVSRWFRKWIDRYRH